MNSLYISIDESGTFASGDSIFVFAGYAILGSEKYNSKLRKYLAVEKTFKTTGEVKASNQSATNRQRLLDVMKNQNSFAIAINNKNLPLASYQDSVAKALIKDDILRNLIIEVIGDYELLTLDQIVIEVDEQNLASGMKQNLYLNLYKQLISGYYNRNQFIKPLAKADLQLTVRYVDSTAHPLVRSSDILAYEVLKKVERNIDVYPILKIFKVL